MGIAVCKRGHLIHANGFYKDGKCKLCDNDRSRRWKEDNQEKHKLYSKKYRIANKEKLNKRSKDWYRANAEKERADRIKRYRENPEKVRTNSRKAVNDITDSYVCSKMLLRVADVPQEVIELKRQHLILKREIKKWKQSQL